MTMCVMPHCLAMIVRLRASAPPDAELEAFKTDISQKSRTQHAPRSHAHATHALAVAKYHP
jgi:hypothetical protein